MDDDRNVDAQLDEQQRAKQEREKPARVENHNNTTRGADVRGVIEADTNTVTEAAEGTKPA